MKKIFKIILYVIGIVLLAFALLIGYFAMNRDKIHDKIITSMRESLEAKVEFDKLDFSLLRDFPAFSIELKNVLIADSLYGIYHVPLIKSKSLFLETSIWNLITLNLDINKVIIDDAALNIFKNPDGYSNDYIFNNMSKKKEKPPVEKKEKSKAKFNIDKVGLYNVGISIKDSVKEKQFGFNFKDVNLKLNKEVNEANIFLTGNIFMEGLTFKQSKGTYIKKQNLFLDAHFHIGETAGLVEILPSKLNVGKAHFDLKGHINTNGNGDLKLMLHNDALTLEDTKNILTEKIYSKIAKYSFLGPMAVDVTLQTALKGAEGDPFITVNANAKGIPLNIAGNEIDSASFHGTFKNYIDSLSVPCDDNSTIVFPDLTALANGIPINGSVKVIDLKNTKLEMDLNGHGELNKLQNFMNENAVAIKGGTLDLKINLKADVNHPYDSVNDKMNGSMVGNILIKNGTILNVPKKLPLTNINARIDIDSKGKGFQIKQLHVSAPGSDLNMTADIEKMILFLFSDKSKLIFNFKLNSDSLNFEPLFSNDSTVVVKPAQKQNHMEQSVANSIDRILKQSEVDIAFNVKHVYARKFNAYDGTGKIMINNNSASITEFAFTHAHGKIKYDATLTKKAIGYEAKFTASTDGVSMPEFMEAFENFNQQSLTQENINGNVHLNINASCEISSGFKLVPNTLRGDMKLDIENGELNNFEPMINLSKYIFKNRGLDSITFTTLSCKANMRGNEIYFNKLYVLSSAISIAMDGIYSFGDSTDLSIQVPLKNLQASSPEYFSSVEKFEKYKGANVFVRGRTKDGKLSFSYDPLKKFRKDKEE